MATKPPSKRAALVLPLATAVGGAALLTHTHAIANARDLDRDPLKSNY